MFHINFVPRTYQIAIAETCKKKNTLVILPTGLGKTKTAILAIVHRLNLYETSKALVLTVTKPLADQIVNEIKEATNITNTALFTGEIKPSERQKIWKNACVIVSTPQCIANDIIAGRISLSDVSTLVLDEIQNCIGDYDYVFVAKHYYQKSNFPRIIGLTASPGAEADKVEEICKNAFIEDIEMRDYDDADVKPYTYEKEVEYVKVQLPADFNLVRNYLRTAYNNRIERLRKLGFRNLYSKKELLGVQRELQAKIAKGEKDLLMWNAVSLVAEAIKIEHAIELFESQGVRATYGYIERLKEESIRTKVKATKRIFNDADFKNAVHKIDMLYKNGIEHPKLDMLKHIVEKEVKKSKIIVFNHYRDSAVRLVEELNMLEGVRCTLFVGQSMKDGKGLTQKQQMEIINDFKIGKFNVVVMTSVGELGLDIPTVDLVVFYEPVPSAIRTIQRMGRTGRHRKGKIIVLVAEKTKDETHRWTAKRKEKNMKQILDNLKKRLRLESKLEPVQHTLQDYQKLRIYVDNRETVLKKYLADEGMDVKMECLEAGDFLVSGRTCVERKTKHDFVDSLVSGRLLAQVKHLAEVYERPLLVIEGMEDIYSVKNVNADAIRGALATIAVDFNIPIVYTNDSKDTAKFLKVLAMREQNEKNIDISIRKEKKPLTIREQQAFIVESLPNVGPKVARKLLESFGNVKAIVNASVEELMSVEGIGKKIANDIRTLLDAKYDHSEGNLDNI